MDMSPISPCKFRSSGTWHTPCSIKPFGSKTATRFPLRWTSPASGAENAGNELGQLRLAVSVYARHADNLARMDFQGQIAQTAVLAFPLLKST